MSERAGQGFRMKDSPHSTPMVAVRARVGSALHRLWTSRKDLNPSLSDVIHDAAEKHEKRLAKEK